MAKKIFTYRGKTQEEIKSLSNDEVIKMLPARQRRSLTRGLSDEKKILLKQIQKGKKRPKTHLRDMVILPSMIGTTIQIHTGKDFIPIMIVPEMIGHYLGEFALSRKRVSHSAPGVGATKSSSSVSVR